MNSTLGIPISLPQAQKGSAGEAFEAEIYELMQLGPNFLS
jgi:hypothetical protein